MLLSCDRGLRRIAALAFAGLTAAAAYAGEPPLVGYLAYGMPGEPTACADDLRRGLAELGMREARDYRFVIRYAMQLESGLHAAAASLATEKPAVLVSGGVNPMLALRAANPRTPLVTIGSGGMIKSGLIDSFARPGGMVTGVSLGETEHGVKALELLLQAFAHPSHVGLIASRTNTRHPGLLKAMEQLAAVRHASVITVWVDGAASIDAAYSQLRAQGVRHAVWLPDWVPSVREHAAAALRNGIASIGFRPNYAAAGGLMNFGPRSLQGCRRAARHVQKILAGLAPAALPVEQLEDYELVINLGVLRQLGMQLAPGFVSRADRVIE